MTPGRFFLRSLRDASTRRRFPLVSSILLSVCVVTALAPSLTASGQGQPAQRAAPGSSQAAVSANAALPHSGRALSGAFLMGAYPGAAEDKTKAATPSPQATDSSQYVGATTCQGCHDELYKGFVASSHWMTTQETKMTHGAHGCESCHGPGGAHVEGGGDKSKIFTFVGAKSENIAKRCLTCHEAKVEQREFMRSPHNENGASCTSCHSIHHSKKEYLLTSNQPMLCYSCHAEQRADFQKTFRHRVNEGLIKCTDCHNVHGTLRDRQVRSAPNQDLICLKCHADKRGPFVFEHEPVRVEGCLACHTPHSSVYPRMLLTARINTLCLQCHVQIPTGVHGAQNTYRSACIICHASIHGSNVSNLLFK